MVIAVFLPDGTRHNIPSDILLARGDTLVLMGYGAGRVDRVTWRYNPSTEERDVRVWLTEWTPE